MRELVVAVLLSASVASAAEPCVPGARVKDRQGVRGTVIESTDRATMCRWTADDGTKKHSLTWMLAKDDGKAGAPAASATAPTAGTYKCSLGAAGNFLLTIASATLYSTAYTGQAGKSGEYSNASGKLSFTSGPLAGNHGAVLGETKVGLSSKPDTKSYYAVCHLQR